MKKLLLTLLACFAVVTASANWKVYYTNPDNWTTPYIYAWNGSTVYTGTNWPGTTMTKVSGESNLWEYEYTGNLTTNPTNVIFSNNGDNSTQTGNLIFVAGATYDKQGTINSTKYPHKVYFRNDNNWSNVYVYAWEGPVSTGGYPGTALSKVTGQNNTYEWSFETDSEDTPQFGGFLFNNDDDSMKTKDIKVFVEGATYLPNGTYIGETSSNPETLYIIGNQVDGKGWGAQNGTASTTSNSATGKYSFSNIVLTGADGGDLAYFGFTGALGSNDDDWGTLNAARYGATETNVAVTPGQVYTMQNNENTWTLGPGKYNFEVDITVPSFTVTKVGDVETPPTPAEPLETPNALYVLGTTYAYNNALVEAWDLENPIQFQSTEKGIFTLKGVEFTGAPAYICFTNAKGTWDELEAGSAFRYGTTSGNQEPLTPGTGSGFKLYQPKSEANWTLEAGVYDIIVNFSTTPQTITVTKSDVEHFEPEAEPSDTPDALYIVGDITGNSWNTTNPSPLELDEDGNFSVTGVIIEAAKDSQVGYFTFINIASDDWDLINDGTHRYGPAANGFLASVGTTNFYLGEDVSWSIVPGNYNFTLNFETGVMTISGTPTVGINNINNALNGEEVIYNLQGVRVNRDKMGKGIYIINGKKVMVK